MTLRVENLAFERNDDFLFRGLSFTASVGQVVRVEGVNGSGKTTLLRIICGLLPAEEGTVFWHDRPIGKHRIEYLSELTYVGHKNGLKGDLTVEENLAIDKVLSDRQSSVSCADALAQFNISDCQHRLCRQLSAGQRQRAALCRLLIRSSRLWVLDEPLTALDKSAQKILENVLQKHLSDGGIAVLTSHHDIGDLDSVQHTVNLNGAA